MQDTLADIRQFQPDVVLTIDSKGFTFRVLKALHADPATRDSIKRMHYVAPSVWAYKHRQRQRDFTQLSRLLHRLFTILPFEEDIFLGKDAQLQGDDERWCRFVGHPAVEDFLEFHEQYDTQVDVPAAAELQASADHRDQREVHAGTSFAPGSDALLDVSKYDRKQLETRAERFRSLMERGRDADSTKAVRVRCGIPAHAFVVCALVGRCVPWLICL